MTKKKIATVAVEPTITAYKGFGTDWKCRDFQYAVGESYENKDGASACNYGFHACEHPLNVFDYYAPAGSKFAVVEQSGVLSRHSEDTKVASSKISIKAEISIAGLVSAAIEYVKSHCEPIDPASPASATGDQGAASATGTRGAAMAIGYEGRASGVEGNALFLVFRDGNCNIIHAKAAVVGRDGIKADTFYMLNALGEFVEAA